MDTRDETIEQPTEPQTNEATTENTASEQGDGDNRPHSETTEPEPVGSER